MATAIQVWVQPFLVGAVQICFMYIGDALTHKLKSTQPSFFFSLTGSQFASPSLDMLHQLCPQTSPSLPSQGEFMSHPL